MANSSATWAGSKYTSSNFLRTGYWRGANGKYYSLGLLKNKGITGWGLYKGSADIAKNSVKWMGRFANGLGYLSAAYSGYKFYTNPNLQNGTETLVGVGAIFFWEVGVVYYAGKSFYELTRINTEFQMSNGLNTVMQFIINKE